MRIMSSSSTKVKAEDTLVRIKKMISDADIKKIDLETALCIASMGGCQTHDALGNLLPSVWCKHYQEEGDETGALLEANDLRKILLQQLQVHIAKRQDLILETEDTAPLVQWIMDFTDDWEKEYRTKIKKQYDISQKIYAAMLEAFQIVEAEMMNYFGHDAVRSWKEKFNDIQDPNTRLISPASPQATSPDSSSSSPSMNNASTVTDLKMFKYEKAAVRMIFRYPAINPVLCKLASKVLQKQEVCNKAGAYSSKVQRNDVTLQYDDAVYSLQEEFQHSDTPFKHILAMDPNHEYYRKLVQVH